jgi:acetyltransferase-like isoleucine patch superfamily enzyme
MMPSKGLLRKLIKLFRLPFITILKLRGLKIHYTSSFFTDVKFENIKCIEIGKHCNFEKRTIFRCFDNNGKKSKLIIGNNFNGNNDLKIFCCGEVTIGDNVSAAGSVFITSENHGLNPLTPSFNDNPLEVAPVKIGDGVWLGEKVIILPGVEIGEKAIIGAGSVVTKNIPPYSIAVGNPARVIKKWDFDKKKYLKVE